jgi:hypothetical protein
MKYFNFIFTFIYILSFISIVLFWNSDLRKQFINKIEKVNEISEENLQLKKRIELIERDLNDLKQEKGQ